MLSRDLNFRELRHSTPLLPSQLNRQVIMGRFYCDYCHCYLTYTSPKTILTFSHDSASVRKAHNLGRGHLSAVKEYYQKLGFEKTQSVIDSLTQDWQANAVVETNPFAAPAGIANAAFGGTPYFAPLFGYVTNAVARPAMGGLPFGGPPMMGGGFGAPVIPGMPLPPPPGMPLPGGATAGAPPPGMMMPGQFPPPVGAVPSSMASGGRVGP
jgi:U1 small nuclear ribonucleoprotein C